MNEAMVVEEKVRGLYYPICGTPIQRVLTFPRTSCSEATLLSVGRPWPTEHGVISASMNIMPDESHDKEGTSWYRLARTCDKAMLVGTHTAVRL